MKRITLQISNEDFGFAKAQAGAYGFRDAAEYLNVLLDSALSDQMDEYEKHGLFRLPDTLRAPERKALPQTAKTKALPGRTRALPHKKRRQK